MLGMRATCLVSFFRIIIPCAPHGSSPVRYTAPTLQVRLSADRILSASCALPTPRHRPAAKEGSEKRRAEAPAKHRARELVPSTNAAVVSNLAVHAPLGL